MSLRDDLVSWWELNEESGTRYDAHGDNDLTDNNTVGYTTGKQGNAADFVKTSNQKLTKSSPTNLDPTNTTSGFSVGCWFKADATGGVRGIISKDGTGGYTLYLNETALDFNNQGVGNIGTLATVSTGTWYFVVVTYDGTDLRGYINGSLQKTTTCAYQSGTGNNFAIGGYATTGTYDFDGLIDEAFFYKDRAISSTEVGELYNSGDGLAYSDTAEASTGTNTKINIGDTFKDVTEYKINVGDSWKTVTEMKVNVGDSWKTVF
jgi:hypothetical protein